MSALGAKFSDFTLVGIFFVFINLLPYGLFFPDLFFSHLCSIVETTSHLLDRVHPSLSVVFGGILATSGLVACTVLGLFVHLMAELIPFSTNQIFAQQIRENSEWFHGFIRRYMKSDVKAVRIVQLFDQRKSVKVREGRHWFAFWKRSERKEVGFLRGTMLEFRALRQIETRMLCYVGVKAGQSSPIELTNQLRYFHVGRSIGTSLGVSFVQFSLILIISALLDPLAKDVLGFGPLIYLILTLLMCLGLFFADRPYSRFCTTLFSFVYEHAIREIRETNPDCPRGDVKDR